jgi:hypothetical protein
MKWIFCTVLNMITVKFRNRKNIHQRILYGTYCRCSEERECNATMDNMRQCIIQKRYLEIEEKKLYSNDYNLQKIIRDLRSQREHTWGHDWDALTRRIRQYQTKLNQIRSKKDQKNIKSLGYPFGVTAYLDNQRVSCR